MVGRNFAVFVILFSLLLFTANSRVGYAGNNITVWVNVTPFSEITVTPAFLNWTAIVPGVSGGQKNISIQNTGSQNVSLIYGYITTLENETVNPYQSADANMYSAGGVLAVRNSTNNAYYWAGRLEWNWTSTIPNTDLSALNGNGVRSSGFFRNASYQYYWAVENGTNFGLAGLTNDTCNNTNTRFAISDLTDDGTSATRSPDPTSITRNGGDRNFSFFSINRATSPFNGQCVAVSSDCKRVFMYKFDKRTGNFNGSLCSNSAYINTGPMIPGNYELMTADVWVPKGIPQGNLMHARWNFVAT